MKMERIIFLDFVKGKCPFLKKNKKCTLVPNEKGTCSYTRGKSLLFRGFGCVGMILFRLKYKGGVK